MESKKDPDDFWDLEKLLPKGVYRPFAPAKKPPIRPLSPHFTDVSLDPEGKEPKPDDKERFSLRESLSEMNREEASEDSFTYTPKENPFLLSVTVTKKKSAYSFYRHFTEDAHRLFSHRGEEAPYISFFSYIPQYSQLNEKQLLYYLWFRESVKERTPIKTDFSYFMLLVYEILNLPDKIPPEIGLDTLIYLWKTYRRDFPQVDKYLATWIPDYCLMHRLPAPTAALSEILPDILAVTDFKEFYLGYAASLDAFGVESLIALASDYRFRYSRYAVGENKALFEKAIIESVTPVLEMLLKEESADRLAGEKRKEHDAFTGSLCAHNLRCRLSVAYHPFEETPRLRHLLTQAVKYAENKLRALLSIKSRLSIHTLPEPYKALINAYFLKEYEARERLKKAADAPAYLALYEAKSHGFSAEDAGQIESDSWETTRLFIKEDSEDFPSPAENPLPETEKPKEAPLPSCPYDISKDAFLYLKAALTQDRSALKELAKAAPLLRLFEEVNGIFFTEFGDIVLENDPASPTVIEDYREDIETLIQGSV